MLDNNNLRSAYRLRSVEVVDCGPGDIAKGVSFGIRPHGDDFLKDWFIPERTLHLLYSDYSEPTKEERDKSTFEQNTKKGNMAIIEEIWYMIRCMLRSTFQAPYGYCRPEQIITVVGGAHECRAALELGPDALARGGLRRSRPIRILRMVASPLPS